MFWLCCTQCHTMRRDSNWLLVVTTGLYLVILPGPRLVSTGHQQPIRGWHGSSWPIRGPGYTQWPGQLPDIWTPAPMHFWCLLSGLSWFDVNTKLINQMLVWAGPMSYCLLDLLKYSCLCFDQMLWRNISVNQFWLLDHRNGQTVRVSCPSYRTRFFSRHLPCIVGNKVGIVGPLWHSRSVWTHQSSDFFCRSRWQDWPSRPECLLLTSGNSIWGLLLHTDNFKHRQAALNHLNLYNSGDGPWQQAQMFSFNLLVQF